MDEGEAAIQSFATCPLHSPERREVFFVEVSGSASLSMRSPPPVSGDPLDLAGSTLFWEPALVRSLGSGYFRYDNLAWPLLDFTNVYTASHVNQPFSVQILASEAQAQGRTGLPKKKRGEERVQWSRWGLRKGNTAGGFFFFSPPLNTLYLPLS